MAKVAPKWCRILTKRHCLRIALTAQIKFKLLFTYLLIYLLTYLLTYLTTYLLTYLLTYYQTKDLVLDQESPKVPGTQYQTRDLVLDKESTNVLGTQYQTQYQTRDLVPSTRLSHMLASTAWTYTDLPRFSFFVEFKLKDPGNSNLNSGRLDLHFKSKLPRNFNSNSTQTAYPTRSWITEQRLRWFGLTLN